MSDESDIDVMNFMSRKGKRSSRIEDSGSSSDSPVEQCKKRKRVLVSNFFVILSLVFVHFIAVNKFVISHPTKIKCKTTKSCCYSYMFLTLQQIFRVICFKKKLFTDAIQFDTAVHT